METGRQHSKKNFLPALVLMSFCWPFNNDAHRGLPKLSQVTVIVSGPRIQDRKRSTIPSIASPSANRGNFRRSDGLRPVRMDMLVSNLTVAIRWKRRAPWRRKRRFTRQIVRHRPATRERTPEWVYPARPVRHP